MSIKKSNFQFLLTQAKICTIWLSNCFWDPNFQSRFITIFVILIKAITAYPYSTHAGPHSLKHVYCLLAPSNEVKKL